jgi:hypothetical protein
MDQETCRDKSFPDYNHKVYRGCAEQPGMRPYQQDINLLSFKRGASTRSAELAGMQLNLLDIVIVLYCINQRPL